MLSITLTALYIILDSIVGTFAVLIITNRDQFHYQYMALKVFHEPERVRYDYRMAQKAHRWSMLIFKGTKVLCGLPLVMFYIVVPLIKFLISRDITDFIAMPFQIIFYDGNTYQEVIINVIHQYLIGVITFIYVFFISSHVFITLLHASIKIQTILELLNEKQDLEEMNEEDFSVWHKALVDGSNDLTDHLVSLYSCFSWCSYLYVKLCYLTMIVVWLSIKIEPKLRILVLNDVAFVVFLYILVFSVETIIEKYDQTLDTFYDLSWYRWTASQKKAFLPFLQFFQRPPYLIAIHERLTFEWFGDFMKKSYSAGCTLASLS